MNFFEQLGAHLGDVDMTIRFFKKNGRFTLNVMPGNKSNNVKPILISGTPEELDKGFFETIAPGIKEISGMITNMDEVKKDVSEKAEKKKATTETKTKTDKKKPGKKKPANKKTKVASAETEQSAPEPSLFEAEPVTQ
jgi:PRTRC genetic system protein E